MSPSSALPPHLRPVHALLAPAWLLALVVLGVNDQLLKGSGLVPEALTGKLSDFAGLFVAPALLAFFARVRTRRGLFLAHAAVAAVFAAIKLSPAAAHAWSGVMGLVGAPWVIAVDATDLVALPSILASRLVLGPAMERGLDLAPARALLARLAAGSGLVLCVATSPVDDCFDCTDLWYEPFSAEAWLFNGAGRDVVVQVRDVEASVYLDCEAIAEDPGRLLTSRLFAPAQTWTMPARTTMPLGELQTGAIAGTSSGRECRAVLLQVEAGRQTLVFWRRGDVPQQQIPGGVQGVEELPSEGGTLIEAGATDFALRSRGTGLLYDLAAAAPQPDSCQGTPDGERLVWSEPIPAGTWRLGASDLGLDGCAALDLQHEDGRAYRRWYLCLPPGAFPFAAGETIAVAPASDALLELRRVSGPELGSLVLTIGRGGALGVPGIAEATLRAREGCGWAPEPACGTVRRPAVLELTTMQGERIPVGTGGSVQLELGAGWWTTVWVVLAEQRAAVNGACAEGADAAGDDAEWVTVERQVQGS